MAPSIFDYLPFRRGSRVRSPIATTSGASQWPAFRQSYDKVTDSADIPLKSQIDVTATEFESRSASALRHSKADQYSESLRPRYTKYGVKGGWRGGARFAFYTAMTVLIINLILFIVCTAALRWMDSMTMVYIGSCTKTERINSGLHFVVNLLSTCLLAASNYCMQLLSAPTRDDVDAAHAKGHWLDVGIPSMRNLRSLKKNKIALWWILAVSSIPLHLLYNSVFFSAIATNDYHILYATPQFIAGEPYNTTQFPDTPEFSISGFQSHASTLERLDRKACMQAYGQDFITDRKDVIAVVRNAAAEDGSLLKIATEVIPPTGLTPAYNSFSWICDDPDTVFRTNACCTNEFGFIPCGEMLPKLEDISSDWWRSGGFDIDYCLSESFPPDCHEHFAPPIMVPVLFFNIFKAVVMWYVAFKYSDKPLVTVGDAIQSFIKNPDPTTKNMCLATHDQIEHHWSKGYIPQPVRYQPRPRRWYAAASKRQWVLLSVLFLIAGAATSIGVGLGIKHLNPSTIQQAWETGLGTVRQQNIISGLRIEHLGPNALFLSALIANAPQAMFSFLYLIYNTIFTTMFLGREWDWFGTHPKGRLLRVSEPIGEQKSTHFLQIPYRYGLVMLAGSGVLHWLVSQSIFLANISVIPLNGRIPLKDEITSCAYSVKGMIFVLVVGFAMVIWLVGNALRRYSGIMVIAGSNSAAISAACHVVGKTGGERDAMVLRPLRWGATEFGGRRATTWGFEQTRDEQDKSESNMQSSKDRAGNLLSKIPGLPMSKYNSSHQRAESTGIQTGRSTSTSPQPYSWMGKVDTGYHGAGADMINSDGGNSTNSAFAMPESTIHFPPPPGSTYLSPEPVISNKTTRPLSAQPSSSTLVSNTTSANQDPFQDRDRDRERDRERNRTNKGSNVNVHARETEEYIYDNDTDAETGTSLNLMMESAADQVGHCSFNDGPVGRPIQGRLYA